MRFFKLLSLKNLKDPKLLNKSVLSYSEEHFKNSKKIIKLLEEYKKILLLENLNMNLIGKSTIDDFDQRHLLDCIQIHKYIKSFDGLIADIGSGAGLPGVILSILGFNNVSLIEKSSKKSSFLNKCKLRLGLNFAVHNSLIEEIKTLNFDVIVARAFAPISKIISVTKQITDNKTNYILLKGKTYNTELKELDLTKYIYHDYPSITSQESRIICLNMK